MPRCKICRDKFEARYFLQKACLNPACLAEWSKLDREKKADEKFKVRKKEFRQSDLKTRKASAKKACHDYIRFRDKDNPCICCGRPLGKKFDAGHFLESGNNPQIRYDENNIHAQNVYCNQYKGGDSDDYEGRLRLKVGDKIVDDLKNKRGGTVKRTCEDYIEIEKHFKAKLKMLQ